MKAMTAFEVDFSKRTDTNICGYYLHIREEKKATVIVAELFNISEPLVKMVLSRNNIETKKKENRGRRPSVQFIDTVTGTVGTVAELAEKLLLTKYGIWKAIQRNETYHGHIFKKIRRAK